MSFLPPHFHQTTHSPSPQWLPRARASWSFSDNDIVYLCITSTSAIVAASIGLPLAGLDATCCERVACGLGVERPQIPHVPTSTSYYTPSNPVPGQRRTITPTCRSPIGLGDLDLTCNAPADPSRNSPKADSSGSVFMKDACALEWRRNAHVLVYEAYP